MIPWRSRFFSASPCSLSVRCFTGYTASGGKPVSWTVGGRARRSSTQTSTTRASWRVTATCWKPRRSRRRERIHGGRSGVVYLRAGAPEGERGHRQTQGSSRGRHTPESAAGCLSNRLLHFGREYAARLGLGLGQESEARLAPREITPTSRRASGRPHGQANSMTATTR